MALYYFDDDKAHTACAGHLADGTALLKAERQRDVDGFWQVLRSAAGQQKLRIKESQRSGDATQHQVPRVPAQGD